MSGPIDLSQLPPPDIIEPAEFEALLAERKAALVALHPVEERAAIAQTLELESEPIVKILQENAYRELLLRQRVNESARAVMLAFATGADLDQLAANFNVKRLVVQEGNPSAVPPVPEVLESHAALRERAQGAFEGLSVAGPRLAYEQKARSADGRVADASAISPEPCEVLVSVLQIDGDGTASPDVLAIVAGALSEEDVRPLGDRVTVQSGEIVGYEIEAVIYPPPGPEAEPIVAAARARAEAYRDERRRLGRSIRRSALFKALHVDGGYVDLIKPAADIVLDRTQAAHCTSFLVTAGESDD
ncbi:MAG: baseplate J/gp47 family protein [Moraxellaceae bacterium]|nr:baseplate J/gp47 family protein [Moraxellaceae bacterium]